MNLANGLAIAYLGLYNGIDILYEVDRFFGKKSVVCVKEGGAI
jgi:hypothetical protein